MSVPESPQRKRRQKKIHYPANAFVQQGIEQKMQLLEMETRWHYFRHFNTDSIDSVIRAVLPGIKILPSSGLWLITRFLILLRAGSANQGRYESPPWIYTLFDSQISS